MNSDLVLGSSWAIWTNLFFLLPLFFAFYNKLYIHGILILMVIVVSFIFHLKSGEFFRVEDQMLAVSLIAANAVLVLNGLQKGGYNPWLTVIILTIIASLLFLQIENHYPESHGLWHFFASIVTLACQYFFLGS